MKAPVWRKGEPHRHQREVGFRLWHDERRPRLPAPAQTRSAGVSRVVWWLLAAVVFLGVRYL